jgi:propanol-preferring alcohol dehydrogenase
VAIFGIGGLGELALQYAQIFGGETIAVDVTDEKLALARRLGARHLVNAANTDPVEAIGKLGGADVAVVLTPDPKAIEQAHASLRRGGRLILVVLPRDDTMSLPVLATVQKGIQIVGTAGGTRADLAEVFRLQAAGRTRVRYEARPLERINDAIDEVLSGQAPAHLVIVP